MVSPVQPIPLAEIRDALERLRGTSVRTPLLRLPLEEAELPERLRGDPPEIYLKLENLQPIGSFKLRGAGNAMALAERCRVIAEGAGASSVAAALTGQTKAGKIVCVVSGGNIDASKLAAILRGEMP